jgi:hypothetical protein
MNEHDIVSAGIDLGGDPALQSPKAKQIHATEACIEATEWAPDQGHRAEPGNDMPRAMGTQVTEAVFSTRERVDIYLVHPGKVAHHPV